MKKVLIIDPHEGVQEALRERLRTEGVEVISVFQIGHAMETFLNHPDVAAVVITSRAAGYEDEQVKLVYDVVRLFKKNFGDKLPLIGMSVDADYLKGLKSAGCDHTCIKMHLPEVLMHVLGISPKLTPQA